jgi:hypothetical protein
MRELLVASYPGKNWRIGQYTASEAALLQERAIIGRLSREELEDRSVYSLRGCPSTGEIYHWQALQGRTGGQVSIQPQRLPFYRRELSLAGSPGGSWRTGQCTASEAAILCKRVIIGRFSTEKLKDRSVSAASEADILQKRDIQTLHREAGGHVRLNTEWGTQNSG